MNKPKVLVLTSSYPKHKGDLNGNFVYELASRLKSDFEIFVLAPAFKGSSGFESVEEIKIYRHKQFLTNNIELAYGIGINENIKRSSVKLLVLPFFFLYQLCALNRITRKEEINIVHAHWILPNGLIAVFHKIFLRGKYKLLATIHGSDIWGFDNRIGNVLKKFILNKIDCLTVVSDAIREKVLEYGYKKEVYVYPMGVDTNIFSPTRYSQRLKKQLKIKGPFLLYVGIIVEQKGIRYLIEAMPPIIQKFPGTMLVIIGEGDLKNEMIELAEKLNIAKDVIFAGSMPHNELPPYFATANLFILPSMSEGWPVVVMEALSSGTKIIVTNISVFEEHKEKGKLFSIVPIGNSEAIADEIIKILDQGISPSKDEDLRLYAQKELDWEVISAKYRRLIINTLAVN